MKFAMGCINNIRRGIMAEIEFFDVKSKSKFKTSDFRIEEKKGRFFAVAKSPSGTHECWKVLSKEKATELKK
jgi:hypothetical protein